MVEFTTTAIDVMKILKAKAKIRSVTFSRRGENYKIKIALLISY